MQWQPQLGTLFQLNIQAGLLHQRINNEPSYFPVASLKVLLKHATKEYRSKYMNLFHGKAM